MSKERHSMQSSIMHEFIGDTGGVFQFVIVRPGSLMLVYDSTVLAAVAQSVGDCIRSAPGAGPICVDCDHEFNSKSLPETFGVWMPVVPGTQSLARIVNMFCARCAARRDAELIEVMERRAKEIMPDSRRLDVLVGSFSDGSKAKN